MVAFDVVATRLWNALHLDLCFVVSVDAFKKQLKIYLFKLAFVTIDAIYSVCNFVIFLNFVTWLCERCYTK